MSKPFRHTFLANLLIIIGICIVLYFLFFASLGWITGHGNERSVPAMIGKPLAAVMSDLEAQGFDIQIDSTYNPEAKPLTIMDQQPEAGMTVKEGRTIFLIVNKQSPPQTPMPNLVTLSFRSAEMLLKSNKLLLGDTSYRPDIAGGSVLAQMMNGAEIAPNTMIPQGSRIDLVIGDGLGNKQISVPDVIGMSYPEAVAMLSGSNLQFVAVFDGIITDSTTAVVYVQQPEAFNELNEPNQISEGEMVDIRVKQDASDVTRP
jgi:beta-lactam-binding protein with PASTA domain